MEMKLSIPFVILVLTMKCKSQAGWGFVGNPLAFAHPCNGSDDITISFESGLPPEDENQYITYIQKDFPKQSKIEIKLDSDAIITLSDKSFARVSVNQDNSFTIRFFQAHNGVGFTVKGQVQGIVPYFTSININTVEYCSKPNVGYLDNYIQGYRDQAESIDRTPKGNCGRRKVTHTELIVNSAPTKAGDWPWHTAIYRIDGSIIKYICGGTLISNNFVLTAAHCATIRSEPVIPEILNVVLGKYNLAGGDTESQEREVHKVIVHDKFERRILENDIALLKLKSEVVFNDYIQPACIWYSKAIDKLPRTDILGTIVGWGFENTDQLAPQLRKATMPKISDSTCIKSNSLFYGALLKNNNKFCAGYQNGTSACNGDSGGAFLVFVPDKSLDLNPNALGSWHVRGIVSVTVSRVDAPICDPNQYVVFTDVEKYRTWIEQHLTE